MPHPARPTNDLRPSYLAAGIVSLAVLALYVITLSPTTAMWDASEYMAAAYTLGVPHPPGNPLFVLLGRTFSVLPIAPDVAQRINLLAALCSALSAGFWFLVAERVLAHWGLGRAQRIAGGAVAALVGATAFTVWNQSVVNEKVYTVSLLGLAAISWLAYRWSSDPDGARADRILVLIAYLLGLGYTNHPAGMLAAPAVAVLVLVRRPRTVLRPRLLAVAVLGVLLGLTPFLTQPIRASHHPPINMGETAACAAGPRVDCLTSAETLQRWKAHVTREQYGKPSLLDRQAPFAGQLATYWQYFEWQWLRDPFGGAGALPRMLALLFLFVGLYGGYQHARRERHGFWYLAVLAFTVAPLLVWYMNFKYGYTQWLRMGEGFDDTFAEVRDRDYFFLWSFSSFGVWVGLGLVAIWQSLAAA
ncbi:MAG: glycosyltransferase family 117 protein, partial [Gemmatimonadaceae bacterium]